jgi:hypothetical protein
MSPDRDPVHVLSIRLHGQPRPVRGMCRRSLAVRLADDAAAAGYDEVVDLGPASPQPKGEWPRGQLVILKDKP